MKYLVEESENYYLYLLKRQNVDFNLPLIISFLNVLYDSFPKIDVQNLCSILARLISEKILLMKNETTSLANLIVQCDLYKVLPLYTHQLLSKLVEKEHIGYKNEDLLTLLKGKKIMTQRIIYRRKKNCKIFYPRF